MSVGQQVSGLVIGLTSPKDVNKLAVAVADTKRTSDEPTISKLILYLTSA